MQYGRFKTKEETIMEKTMTYASAAAFAAFIAISTVVPNWLLIAPVALVISELALPLRKDRK